MKLSIIIVNHNTTSLVQKCIASVQEHLKESFEIIVVDNSSNEQESANAKEAYSGKEGIQFLHVANKGYGEANNRGAEIARGEYLLLLNPDTLIVDDSISKLVKLLSENPKIGALSPLIYQENGKTLQNCFFCNFQSLAGITIKKWQGKEIDLNKEIIYVDMITGACMMMKRSLFNELQGFDENFFMYIEDDDLCRRITQAGYKNAVYTKAKIIHLEGKSSTSFQKRLMYYKSQDYYWRKHYGVFQMVLMKIIRWPYKVLRILLAK